MLGSTGSYGDFVEVISDRLPVPGLEPSILPLEGQSEFVAEQLDDVGCERMGERDRVSLWLRAPPGSSPWWAMCLQVANWRHAKLRRLRSRFFFVKNFKIGAKLSPIGPTPPVLSVRG